MQQRMAFGLGVLVLCSLLSERVTAAEPPGRVTVWRTPNGGIQPQAVIDTEGSIHLIYFQGRPEAGDLFYTHRKPARPDFAPAIRVNRQAGTAVALGTIRGGQIALGRQGRVHVAWNGAMGVASKEAHDHVHDGAPLFYARSNGDRTAFKPQRDLIRRTNALDGGGTVAADFEGNVYVAWHGRTIDSVAGEMGRKMWVAHSQDSGETFAPEQPVWQRATGACGCCGTRALADSRGAVYLLYRAATRGTERDMYLLTSHDHAAHWDGNALQAWRINSCPMSSESLAETPTAVLAAWETQGQVNFVRIDPRGGALSQPVSPPGRAGERKHPAIAGDAQGNVILVWAERTGWQKGGALAWQVFNKDDEPTNEKGTLRDGIPVWSLPTVVAQPDGNFVIIH